LTLIVYVAAAVDVVVEIVTGVETPAAEGVTLNDAGVTVTAVDEEVTVQETAVVVPENKVATTLAVVEPPAVTVALDGFHATV
jgi:hypothetical protein